MSSFNRENRYIVLKRKHLANLPSSLQLRLKPALDEAAQLVPTFECLVIENDWPEYEPAWQMIEQRMTGAAPVVERQQPEPVGVLMLGEVFNGTQGLELDDWDVDWYRKPIDELNAANPGAQLKLYVEPPELAELQATIASQAALLREVTESVTGRNGTFARIPADWFDRRDADIPASVEVSEIERLKGGHGEPVAVVTSVVSRKNKRFEIEILDNQKLHVGTWLYTSQPAPVSVVLDERAEFVAWVRREWPQAPLSNVRDLLLKDDPRYGEYCDETLQRAWVGWQARACLDKVKELNK